MMQVSYCIIYSISTIGIDNVKLRNSVLSIIVARSIYTIGCLPGPVLNYFDNKLMHAIGILLNFV